MIMTEKYTICGLVQGVGFRPSVKRAALKYGVRGAVKNIGGAVEVTAQGNTESIIAFKAEIKKISGAVITDFIEESVNAPEFKNFSIAESGGADITPMLSPDIATCGECMEEFYDEKNRRYRHPFISCTKCGPRYSIIRSVPYDRENITMSEFDMCDNCEKEYKDVSDKRAHAQTIACNSCGPALSYTIDGDPLDEAVKTLRNGGIAAIKDIGGYHFACGALNADAVKRLREIKQRETKPFAVMFHDIKAVREYALVSDKEETLLLSPARPIALLKKRKELARGVCDENDRIGAFLPCNPVQDYLTKQCGALVMTSANLSGAPIIADDEEIKLLYEKTGGFEILSHNRAIENPSDDSVCRVICGKVQLIRRARGYTPLPISIGGASSVLAAGGDLKAAFCYTSNGRAYMSRYFGDLENPNAYAEWKSEIKKLGNLLNIKDYTFIRDAHPLYYSASYADGSTLLHHYAHMASVMAEHHIENNALGFIFDGTGYGGDGCVWGGEIISYNNEFTREASLEYTELLGGDESAKSSALTLDCFLTAAGIAPRGKNREIVKSALKNHINTVKSSSMGRLFDAVSSLLGISEYNSYEGESAIMLELAAKKAETAYPLELPLRDGKWRSSELIRSVDAAMKNGADRNSLALGFHMAVINAVCNFAKTKDKETNIILSGGVFANELLTELCFENLTAEGYRVYINEQAPCNDGGIALGQAWYALRTMEGN